jgi:hypothetical protein
LLVHFSLFFGQESIELLAKPGRDRLRCLSHVELRGVEVRLWSDSEKLGASIMGPLILRLCCKSRKLQGSEFFANTKREAIADSYNLIRVTEVAC